MVTVVVPDKPPMCPPMSLAWMTTRYSSLISRSIPWRATFMVAVAGDRSKPMNAFLNRTVHWGTHNHSLLKNSVCCVNGDTARWTRLSKSLCRNHLCLFKSIVPLHSSVFGLSVNYRMLSVLYNLEYCMQNGRYWLSHGSAYKKGSAQAYRDNPLRKQRAARSSNEYKPPHKSWALAWHPASVLSCLRQ